MSGKRVVVKVGSSTLTREDGTLDIELVRSFAEQVAQLRAEGDSVVLVSSGAIAAGLSRLGILERPTDMPSLQAAASIGQVALVETYSAVFAEKNIPVGQVLLTRHDTGHRESYLHARDTFDRLLALGAVPVVNENDTVAVDEIRFGDNDTLAALVATMIGANLVVLLSDIEGVFDCDPRVHDTAELLHQIDQLTDEVVAAAGGSGSAVGTGGMTTKVEAARVLMRAGIPMVVCDGRRPNVITDAAHGVDVGTVFEPDSDPLGAKKLWIAMARKVAGEIVVDDGARKALRERHTSLLPAGVLSVVGTFKAGDAVVLVDASGGVVARGLAGLSAEEIELVKGLKTSEIDVKAPSLAGREVVHRDHLAIL